MSWREQAAVFFFDILGFGALVGRDHDAAVDALSTLAAVLNLPGVARQTEGWAQRYALSDSVFPTRPDIVGAVKGAADLMANLIAFTANDDAPNLVRGALAFGTIEHVRGIFDVQSGTPANLVGAAVAEAVALEHQGADRVSSCRRRPSR